MAHIIDNNKFYAIINMYVIFVYLHHQNKIDGYNKSGNKLFEMVKLHPTYFQCQEPFFRKVVLSMVFCCLLIL